MPGTFIIKPIEATLSGAVTLGSYSQNIDPYCEVKIGHNTARSHPSKDFGRHPHWDEELIVQQGDDTHGKVLIKDTNRFNPNKNIGEVDLDLNQLAMKGHVAKWFTINHNHRKQGEILLDVTYTQGNPLSREFHHSAQEGAAIEGTTREQIERDIVTAHPITSKDRREFEEATRFGGFARPHYPQEERVEVKDYTHSNRKGDFFEQKAAEKRRDPTLPDPIAPHGTAHTGMSNPNTMKLGVNHRMHGETFPNEDQIGGADPQPRGRYARKQMDVAEVPAKPFWETKDPTVKNTRVKPGSANSGMSNPNTMKLGVNHDLPAEHHHYDYPPETVDPHPRVHHSRHQVELPDGPRKGPWEARDPTINHTRVHPGYADSGMSNPNTMKLGVNHDLPSEHHHYDYPPETVDPHPRIHHSRHQVELPDGPKKGPWEARDPTINHTRVHPGYADSGMSNPNTMKLGVNHDLPSEHHHYDYPPETVDPHPRVHHSRHQVELPDGPRKGPWEARDPTINHTKVHPGYADSGMSNPNTMKLGVNHESHHVRFADEAHTRDRSLSNHSGGELVDVDDALGPINRSLNPHDPATHQGNVGNRHSTKSGAYHANTYAHGRKSMNQHSDHIKANQIPSVADSQPRGRYSRNTVEPVPEVPYTGHSSVKQKPGNTGMSNPNMSKLGVNQHHEHGRFHPNVDTITDAEPRGRYSRNVVEDAHLPVTYPAKKPWQAKDPTLNHTNVKPYTSNTGMSNPNTMKLGVNHLRWGEEVPMDDPMDHAQVQRPVGSAPYEATYGPSDLSDTGMSNPNMVGIDYQRLKGMRNAQEMLLAQKRVEGLQESSHHQPFGIDKITKTNDTSLGCYQHPEHYLENGMSDPNNARYGLNHYVERPSLGESEGYTTAEHTGPVEIDKITTVHDTTLGAQKDMRHVWDSGMSDPNSMQKGWNHANSRGSSNWNSQRNSFKRDVGPYEVDKITTTHDIRLQKNKRLY